MHATKQNNHAIHFRSVATIALFLGSFAPVMFAQHAQVLYVFPTPSSADSGAKLIVDNAGNLYGTTSTGGTGSCSNINAPGCGTVFELSPQPDGSWLQQTLYNFQNNGTDGEDPYHCTLLRDGLGNLYGTTVNGGDQSCSGGCGTVFELSPQAGGGWVETQLHKFYNDPRGALPEGGVTRDAHGHLYGTTHSGQIFELTHESGGQWAYKVLYTLGSAPDDGSVPNTLVLDAAGNIYGTTLYGGRYSCQSSYYTCGTVFELALQSDGSYAESILHDFQNNGADGFFPNPNLILDAAGNLYGTTSQGGSALCEEIPDCGVAFELMPQGNGSWSESILAAFDNDDTGVAPVDGMTFDPAGNLWGTTSERGSEDCGSVFQLAPQSDGSWTLTANSSFFSFENGCAPESGLVRDGKGRFFGTTSEGTANDGGTVYGFKP